MNLLDMPDSQIASMGHPDPIIILDKRQASEVKSRERNKPYCMYLQLQQRSKRPRLLVLLQRGE